MLKAASIIVEVDEKHFCYNPTILKDLLDNNSEQSEEELIEERIQLTVSKAANNLSLQSSGS